MKYVSLDYPRPDLAVVALHGDGSLNLMSYGMLKEMWLVANTIQENRTIRAVVIIGKEKAFSAGMNLKQDEVREFQRYTIEQRIDIHSIGARVCAAWSALDAVTISAIEGYCIGGGLAFSIVCDFRVASSSSQFGAPELENGMNMSWQSIPRLVSLVGPSRTRRLVMLTEKIDAFTAEKWGLVDQIVDAGSVQNSAIKMAGDMLALSSVPLRMTKHAINVAANTLNHAVSYMDVDQYVLCQDTPEHRTALDRFFQKK